MGNSECVGQSGEMHPGALQMNILSSSRWVAVISLDYPEDEPFHAIRTLGITPEEMNKSSWAETRSYALQSIRACVSLMKRNGSTRTRKLPQQSQHLPPIERQQKNHMRASVPTAQCTNTVSMTQFAEDFKNFLPLPLALDQPFEEALRYVLDNPGSLVRPRMVFQMATAYGLEEAPARDLAVALEYFHTASLVFDDLPCMDNALERRDAPCVHFAFGEAGAILTALALINRAYALTWHAVLAAPPQRQRSALAYIEHCLGVEGLLNGQSLDLNYSTLPHTRESTERIARGKTVSLIRLTLVLPAMLGGASAREIQLLERICPLLGPQLSDGR